MALAGDLPVAHLLPDGRRLHLRHGPIDLIVLADGDQTAIRAAHAIAARTFRPVLNDLVADLDWLRKPFEASRRQSSGPVAARMLKAVSPFARAGFLTPMIAVAGAVADHLLAQIKTIPGLRRASVNNGGDIALWLSDDEVFKVGICEGPHTSAVPAIAPIDRQSNIGGIATSGWRGRSFSLGIADAVTVLARDAATADTAATLIANAVDLPRSSKISRQQARTLAPDSDLGKQLVTTGVAPLSAPEIDAASSFGVARAERFIAEENIIGASLMLQGVVVPVSMGSLLKAHNVRRKNARLQELDHA